MMKLIDLGFDPWFEAHVDDVRHDLRQEDQGIARVSAVDRNSCMIRNELREIPAELAGKFSFHVESPVNLPCVGDWVTVQYHVEPMVILAKTDLIPPDELQQKLAAIRQASITTRVIALSNITGSGFDEFQQVLMPVM